ncbi:hypothetical protein E1267_42315 [Nonomuraea longispora]|uniref:SH3 domain-containing protein n=1 Tax=Nonomuraea longispora TaxID=1848320 RepID=A0A4R4MH75_9ACTN|nr:hypothetical protein [Nonomuraea longispora]TDB95017.1 hypothetical protein E1267_42315 [Nonomuraea longispora]
MIRRAAQAAGDGQPCGKAYRHGTYKVHNCPDWSPSGSIPVHKSPRKGTIVGYINPSGDDWYLCEKVGARYTLGRYQNFWWAATMADNNKWGYVNEVYFRGGGNNEPDAGLHTCSGPGGKQLPQ